MGYEELVECIECGKLFHPTKCGQKICCAECRRKRQTRQSMASGEHRRDAIRREWAMSQAINIEEAYKAYGVAGIADYVYNNLNTTNKRKGKREAV